MSTPDDRSAASAVRIHARVICFVWNSM